MFRRALIRVALIAVAVVLGSSLVLARPARAAGDPASAFLDKINALRASKGIGPLTMDGPLSTFAAGWNAQMAQSGTLSHNPNLASAPNNWTVVGENVGDGTSVDAIFAGFSASAHHYANMVDPRFNAIGIAVLTDSAGRMWTTHDFEQVPAAPAPKVASAPKPAAAPAPVAKPAPAAPTPAPAAAPAPAPAPQAAPVVAAVVPAPQPVPARMQFSLEGLRGDTPAF